MLGLPLDDASDHSLRYGFRLMATIVFSETLGANSIQI